MLGSMDISQFSPRLILVISFTVIALIAFSVFPMIVGAGNTVKLNTEEACTVNGVRTDKVLKVETGVTNANKADWSESIALSETTAGKCAIDDISVARAAGEIYWLPTGQKVKVETAGTTSDKAVLKNSEWEDVPRFFPGQHRSRGRYHRSPGLAHRRFAHRCPGFHRLHDIEPVPGREHVRG